MSSVPSTSIPDKDELKECLKEAGLYEENMSQREMMNYYNAIRSSKNTALQENEQRTILESTEKNCQLLEELKEKLGLNVSTPQQNATQKETDGTKEDVHMAMSTPSKTPVKETLNKPEEAEDKETCWNFFKCPPLKHKPLDIVSHTPKYNLPIYCDPEILKLPFETRTKYIYHFHRLLLDEFYNLHCESLNPAPWGKPIQEDPKFNNASLDRKAVSLSEECETEELSTVENSLELPAGTEIYTSRAGRQTKRKVYVENEEEKLKKSKKDEDDDFQIHTKSIKRPTLSRYSRDEVMKRSKLFANDSPKISHTDMIFTQLYDEHKKGKQMQKIMENFKSTLPPGSDEDDDETESEHNTQETPKEIEIRPQQVTLFKRKSLTTPQGRKSIRKTSSERGKGRTVKINIKSRSQETLADNPDIQEDLLEEAAGWGDGKAKCPICSEVFSQDIIEEHASSCGLGMDTESNFENVPRDNPQTAKCPICNRETFFSMNYESHLKECIARTASNSSNES